MQKARKFFTERLKKLEDYKITKILESMKKAEMLEITFDNKKDSVLVFELQNNRGKDLANLEKLKSYLSYQIYTYYSADEAESKLNKKTFEEIYRLIPSMPLITPNNKNKKDEDPILGYYNQVQCGFGYDYRENDNDLNYKKVLKNMSDARKKLEFIDDYVSNLKQAFLDFKSFCECGEYDAKRILELDVDAIYPFIIKAYQLYRENKNELEKIFEALEIMAFRQKIIKGADLRTKLNTLLKDDFKDTNSLIEGLKKVCDTERNEWSDATNNLLVFSYRSYAKINNKDIIKYILKRYEDYLRQSSPKASGYQSLFDDGIKYEIEHIAPQTENKQENSGYCDYKDFEDGIYKIYDEEEAVKERLEYRKQYLNCIGNLVLISPTHNRSNGNDTFNKKLEGFNTSPLAQQREIMEFALKYSEIQKDGMPFWGKDAIAQRSMKLEAFVNSYWDLSTREDYLA